MTARHVFSYPDLTGRRAASYLRGDFERHREQQASAVGPHPEVLAVHHSTRPRLLRSGEPCVAQCMLPREVALSKLEYDLGEQELCV